MLWKVHQDGDSEMRIKGFCVETHSQVLEE